MIKFKGDPAKALRDLDVAFAKASAALKRAADGGGDREMLRKLGEVDAKQNIQAFASQGAASGEKWPSLLEGEGNMEEYVKWKGRNWPNRLMNVWRGDTRDSLTQAGAAHRIVRQSGNVIELGTSSKLAAKMQTGESPGGWKSAYLKEKTPVFPKGSRSRQRRDRASGQFASGKERVHKGRVVKGRRWFTFWYREIPARPVVRKSAAQADGLKRELAREMFRVMREAAGTNTPLGRHFAAKQGAIPRWNQ